MVGVSRSPAFTWRAISDAVEAAATAQMRRIPDPKSCLERPFSGMVLSHLIENEAGSKR
jgi:hypothetical protein